ncbi:Cupin-2 domain-containing protein [Fusarium sp. Ph1]|nr:Cupin-2 domain-containing protein [Fusarium sp. Ph1]
MPILDYFSILRPGGKFVQLGASEEPVPVPIFPLMQNGLSLCSSGIGSPAEIRDMLDLAVAKNARPWVQLRPMPEANEAMVNHYWFQGLALCLLLGKQTENPPEAARFSDDRNYRTLMDSSPITRVVTGHHPDGTATVTRLDAIPSQPAGFGINIAKLWSTAEHPANVDSDNDKGLHNWGISPLGTIFNAADFPPRTKTPLHRSLTVDYVFLHRGTLVLHLDDGSRTTLKEGDVAVVQAGMHSWENPTDETARAVSVMVAAEAPVVAGKTFEVEVSDANT